MTLNPFMRGIKRYSPRNGRLIENELDIDLRNSFAHGLFRIEIRDRTEPRLLYYKSLAELENPAQIPLSKLMIKMKNHNLIYHCLVHLVSEKLKEGFFRDA